MTFSLGGESVVLRVGKLCPPMTSIQPVLLRVGGGKGTGGGGALTTPVIGAVTLPLRGPNPTPDSWILNRFCLSQ